MPIHLVLLANMWVTSLWLVLPFVVVLFLACLLHFMLLFCHLFFTFYCYVCLQNVSVLRSCTWPLFVFHPICFCFCVFFLSVFCHCHSDCHALPCFAEVGQAVWKVGVAMWGSKVNTFLIDGYGVFSPRYTWSYDRIMMIEIKMSSKSGLIMREACSWCQWDRPTASSFWVQSKQTMVFFL